LDAGLVHPIGTKTSGALTEVVLCVLQLDIEGYEPYAIKGAQQLLKRCNVFAIYMELSTVLNERMIIEQVPLPFHPSAVWLSVLRASCFRLGGSLCMLLLSVPAAVPGLACLEPF
jgi:hypothetical protein